ncbi:aldehyde dehydrogenase family protein [Bacillus spizizenii ATCC 6633 = JCM 2499]|uniref:Aldehyde dehydrogenase n=1 Tax=Bacillus spizizenii (strain ATCC 23059 / NRRL B-14472 / W23) TaxID=655816 RepID=E0TYH7_BACSH|nr:aldehyde dehydrogenase family protein [Bacillus spizizenii]QCJ19036.1 aldehyde dehydrogenase family protein [Bacillus subtilis]ADM40012.1 putative aldehyde dehydrogenase [Bacillus spizizenii str. W23]AJW85439.1 aldehyde dehydrogenase [Bacillus spizizenii]EFG93828.1 putative aldehyde dehydrogenase [Bacillus spizizenii ATCC 6633 = JCM 2499]KFK77706.1 acyl-CoA reductase family protein [Bacillus spizizenii]
MEQQVKDDIQRVFQLQKKQQKALRASTAEQRIEKLQRFLDSVIAHEEEIIEAIRKDVRKPYHEVKKAEIEGTKKAIRDNMNNLEQWMAPKEVGSSLSPDANGILMYEPKGMTLILGPWNYPFMLTMAPLAASLAAGNSAIVKLSDFTMNTSNIAAKVIRDAFDEKEVAIFEGEVEVATELLDQPFDHIFFTGSTNVGKIVMTAAAKHLASVTLELGGKSPTIIDSEYDLMDAAKKIAVGKFVNAGQTCIAPDYLFIKKDVQDRFAGMLQTIVNAGFMEDDHNPDRSKFTQIVNDRNFNRVKDLFDDAIEKGAEVVFGGVFDASDRTISPTVLKNVTPDMKIMQEEIFAPILPMMNYENIDEVIDYVNDRDKPLALYVFSHNQDLIDNVLQHTTSGNAAINDVVVHFSDVNLPFGGVNTSGIGSYHGVYGFKEFSHEKGVFIQAAK